MAGLSRSEYEAQLNKKSSGATVTKFILRSLFTALMLVIMPIAFVIIFGVALLVTLVLGTFTRAVALPDFK